MFTGNPITPRPLQRVPNDKQLYLNRPVWDISLLVLLGCCQRQGRKIAKLSVQKNLFYLPTSRQAAESGDIFKDIWRLLKEVLKHNLWRCVTLQMCEAHRRLQLDIDQRAHRIWCTQTYWDTTLRIASACFQMHWAWETERLGCFKSSVQLPPRQVPGSMRWPKRPPIRPCLVKNVHTHKAILARFFLIQVRFLRTSTLRGNIVKAPLTVMARKKGYFRVRFYW